MEEKKKKKHRIRSWFLSHKLTTAVFVVLICCLISMSGTVSSAESQIESLTAQLQEQTEQYEKAQNDLATLTAQYEDLQDEVTHYEDQQETIDDLNAKLTKLRKKYKTVSSENASLKSKTASSDNQSSGTTVSSKSADSSSDSDSGSGDMVWLSATGSKYHSIPNCGRMNPDNARQISRSSAEAQGYDACSNCW